MSPVKKSESIDDLFAEAKRVILHLSKGNAQVLNDIFKGSRSTFFIKLQPDCEPDKDETKKKILLGKTMEAVLKIGALKHGFREDAIETHIENDGLYDLPLWMHFAIPEVLYKKIINDLDEKKHVSTARKL